jgi:hypothetical protein
MGHGLAGIVCANLDLLAYGDCPALASEIILFPADQPYGVIANLVKPARGDLADSLRPHSFYR